MNTQATFILCIIAILFTQCIKADLTDPKDAKAATLSIVEEEIKSDTWEKKNEQVEKKQDVENTEDTTDTKDIYELENKQPNITPKEENQHEEEPTKNELISNSFDEINQLVDAFFGRRSFFPTRRFPSFRNRFPLFPRRSCNSNKKQYWPKTDVVDAEKELKVNMELPGVNMEDIKITVNDDTLSIKGEKTTLVEDMNGGQYSVKESTSGLFQREVRLPRNIDTTNTKASLINGILSITMPKLDIPEPVTIQIGTQQGKM